MTSVVSRERIPPFIEPAKFEDRFIEIFQRLVRPFYRAQSLPALEAVSIKPSGIWYANAYSAKLLELGDTPVPVKDKMIPASKIHSSLRERGFFYHLMAPSKYWSNLDHPPSLTGKHFTTLVMNKGVSAREAFESFEKQLSFLDCNLTVQVAIALVISEFLGKEIFDELALKMGEIRLGTDPDKFLLMFMKFVKFSPPSSLLDPLHSLVKSQQYYIRNTTMYTKKHIHGVAAGYHLIYMGNSKFMGLGLDPSGVTLAEIAKVLFEEYNADPIDEETIMPTGKGTDFIGIRTMDTDEITRVSFNQIKALSKGQDLPKGLSQEMVDSFLPMIRAKEEERRALKMTKEQFLTETDFFRDIPFCFQINLDNLLKIISSIRE
jgi:hypothetical protein